MPKHTFTTRILPALTAIVLFFLVGNSEAAAAKVTDGTYEVEYTVKKPDNDSASIANDYFEKPARVEVRNGEAVVYFQTNHNKWITSLKYPAGPDAAELEVVESNETEDKKVYRLQHADVLVPAALLVHVKIDELGYDQEYTIRLVFKTERLPLASESAPDAKPVESAAGPGQQAPAQQQEQAAPQINPSATAPEQAEQSDPPVVDGSEQPEQQDQMTAGAAAEASPEPSAENAAPAVSDSDAADAADSRGQAAEPLPSSSAEAEASGSSAWPAIVAAILAVGVLAACGGWAYRRRRNKARL